MSLIAVADARAHLRVESDYPDAQMLPYLLAAEDQAQQFMNRRVYSDAQALEDAQAAVPAMLDAAAAARATALQAAMDLDDATARSWFVERAHKTYADAQYAAQAVSAGIVLNDSIRIGILLMLGHLHENREDVVRGAAVELPKGAHFFLWPYRIGIGV